MPLSWFQKATLLLSIPATGILLFFLLKKNDEEEEDEEVKERRMASSRQTVIEFPVPKTIVGAVIGPHGDQIKKIQDTTGARVNFRDDVQTLTSEATNADGTASGDRIVIIRGTQESAQDAELMIRKIITDQPPVLTEKIFVPDKAIGRIIGRNGDTIRNLSRISKAKIVIDRSDVKRGEGMKDVTLIGTPLAIASAKALIIEKIEDEEQFQAKMTVSKINQQQQRMMKGPRQNYEAPTMTATPETTQQPPISNGHSSQPCFDSSVPAVDGLVDNLATVEDEIFPADSTFQLFVSAVEHPGHFWVQVVSQKGAQLEKLIQDMNNYYESDTGKAMQVESDKLEVNNVVAAIFPHDGRWYRAKVMEIGEFYDLYFVDFGDSEIVDKHKVKPLRSDFLILPFQAFEVCLANVRPFGDTWSEAAIVLFEKLTFSAEWKVIMAKTVGYKQSDIGLNMIPCLHLVNTHGPQDVDIADELVAKGFAIHNRSDEVSQPPSTNATSSTVSSSTGNIPQTNDLNFNRLSRAPCLFSPSKTVQDDYSNIKTVNHINASQWTKKKNGDNCTICSCRLSIKNCCKRNCFNMHLNFVDTCTISDKGHFATESERCGQNFRTEFEGSFVCGQTDCFHNRQLFLASSIEIVCDYMNSAAHQCTFIQPYLYCYVDFLFTVNEFIIVDFSTIVVCECVSYCGIIATIIDSRYDILDSKSLINKYESKVQELAPFPFSSNPIIDNMIAENDISYITPENDDINSSHIFSNDDSMAKFGLNNCSKRRGGLRDANSKRPVFLKCKRVQFRVPPVKMVYIIESEYFDDVDKCENDIDFVDDVTYVDDDYRQKHESGNFLCSKKCPIVSGEDFDDV